MIYAGNMHLENHLISSLNDYFQRKKYSKIVIWTVLDSVGLILSRTEGPNLTGTLIPSLIYVAL